MVPADHIVAVYQGGGLCDLENLRTLCVICHQVRSPNPIRVRNAWCSCFSCVRQCMAARLTVLKLRIYGQSVVKCSSEGLAVEVMAATSQPLCYVWSKGCRT